MRFFPESTLLQLEFDKIKTLLAAHARTELGKSRCLDLRIHTKKEFIDLELSQTAEYKMILDSGQYFPNDFTLAIQKELKLLSIPGSSLSGEQFLMIRRLSDSASQIFRWFDAEKRSLYPGMAQVIHNLYDEKNIREMIDEVLDEIGQVRDHASEELASIRSSLYRKRNELRKLFDRIVAKLRRQGYLADTEESFMNGRRVLAVFAEQKRMVKGVMHAESDSRRTSFIEPEETTELNNDIFSLEHEESREVYRILRQLTQNLSVYASVLQSYYRMNGDFDFIRAKARLAIDTGASHPMVIDQAHIELREARHPLLLLFNAKTGKPTIPVNLTLDAQNRILVISGPNAGGKTVTLKTVGLLQLMMQSGLLVSASPDSRMGIFKQLMIHIGDTQSLEFELSTYSSHLKNMKHFLEHANGKTLFFIDELGSGSDPNLGGAFAEVILEELARKHSFGIVTTHYLNLKVMAQKVPGIINGAMQFDEQNLLPLYKLQVGKPGSSYTFSIAERIGLDKRLINRARQLADESHVKLDALLNSTEQDLQQMEKDRKKLDAMIRDFEKKKKELLEETDKERHRQEMERARMQHKITEDKIQYLKDTERKLKALVMEWRKAEDKDEVVKMIHALLFRQKEKMQQERRHKKLDESFIEVSGDIRVGDQVKMRQSRQVGLVKEIRGRKALLQVGVMPITVSLSDLTLVRPKENSGQDA